MSYNHQSLPTHNETTEYPFPLSAQPPPPQRLPSTTTSTTATATATATASTARPKPQTRSTKSTIKSITRKRPGQLTSSNAPISGYGFDSYRRPPRPLPLPSTSLNPQTVTSRRPSFLQRASRVFQSSRLAEEGFNPTKHSDSTKIARKDGSSGSGTPGSPDSRPNPLRRGSTLLEQGEIAMKHSYRAVVRELFKDIGNDSIAMAVYQLFLLMLTTTLRRLWEKEKTNGQGEFVGTVLFLLISLGAVQTVAFNLQQGNNDGNVKGDPATRLLSNYYQAAAFGFALYATSSIFYRFTGSIFNPSVSLALALIGVIRPVRFFLVSLAQILGGIAACYLVHGLLPGTTEINLSLGEETSPVKGLFIEMFASFGLILNVLMLGAEKHLVTPHAPLGFGLTLFALILFSIEFTGSGINVARAFGASCLQGFQPYHWIYWLGPTMGSVLATGFYAFLKAVHYWKINPGQDATGPLVESDEVGPIQPGSGDNPEQSEEEEIEGESERDEGDREQADESRVASNGGSNEASRRALR